MNIKNENLKSLVFLIRKKITIRILFCFLFLGMVLVTFATYDLMNIFSTTSKNLDVLSQQLGEFIISQSLIQNQSSIDIALKRAGEENMVDITWIQNKDGGGKSIRWSIPFAWKYTYYVNSIDNKHFGAIQIIGSILKNEAFVKEFLFSFLLLLTAIGVMFALLLPLANKIPNELFLLPIKNLLDLLKNNRSEIKKTNSIEMQEISNTVAQLIAEIKKDTEKKAIGDLALQVAHDIRSPTSAILMLAKECIDLPEKQRLTLQEAATRIQDIANYLLNHYDNKQQNFSSFLASSAILLVLSEKRIEYKSLNVNFLYETSNDASFAFIKANLVDFKRVLSNVINNAVEAIDHSGRVIVRLTKEQESLTIKIIDNGMGIPNELANRLLSEENAVSNKKTGHGFGLSHAKSFLKHNNGSMNITSISGKGTEISLTFKTITSPIWITSEITLNPCGQIIILDDDISIHGAWDAVLEPVTRKNPFVQVVHFTSGKECIGYINKLQDKDKLILLADYELMKENINGLDVIESTGIPKAILVTSHDGNIEIIKRAIMLNTKILPKALTPYVCLQILASHTELRAEPIDLILLEDNKEFSEVLSYLYGIRKKKFILCHTPYELFSKIEEYNKETKICLDYNLNCPVSGIELAKVLWQKGYHKLYLATGMQLEAASIPPYLTLLKEKMELLNL